MEGRRLADCKREDKLTARFIFNLKQSSAYRFEGTVLAADRRADDVAVFAVSRQTIVTRLLFLFGKKRFGPGMRTPFPPTANCFSVRRRAGCYTPKRHTLINAGKHQLGQRR